MAQIDDKSGHWLNKKNEGTHPDLIRADEKIKDELVEKLIKQAIELSATLNVFKKDAFEQTNDYFELLLQNYDLDAKKNSKKGNITLENYSGTMKVQIANADSISFDEKLQIAKLKIDECLHELTEGASPEIKTLITKSFEVDKKGEINAKKILALKAYDISHPKWREAMIIIDESIEIVGSKAYIRFYTRDRVDKEYKLISLDLAGA
ncbi:DUF3164 family protein [Sulfurimonas sp.]|uniref:DUF3164 family protein n=1 Tax=Sulfurimonas sp. TaxID=2022749 RepID=UPI002B479B9A|nr:DUF3164 family protein [Sulfurimonas sp.]